MHYLIIIQKAAKKMTNKTKHKKQINGKCVDMIVSATNFAIIINYGQLISSCFALFSKYFTPLQNVKYQNAKYFTYNK